MQGESDNMEKKVQIGMLCEIYGNLLTKRQLNILNDYCNEDLSFYGARVKIVYLE